MANSRSRRAQRPSTASPGAGGRERRRARMASARAQRAAEGPAGGDTSHRWPFPCAWVCGACGYLRRPEDQSVPHPLRSDAELEGTVTTSCPHCDAPPSSAVDLADKAMARSLIDGELHDQQHTPRLGPLLGDVAAGAVVAGVGATLIATGLGLVAGVAGLGGAGVFWAKAATDWKTLRGRAKTPRRWFHAPRPEPPLEVEGPLELTGPSLRAPLSGRACLAYEVTVRWANGDPDDPRTLALLEQKIGALGLRGAPIDPEFVFLELPHTPLVAQDVHEREPARIYLASRGLTSTDGEFIFAEAVLEQHARVDVLRDARGAVSLRLSTAPPEHGQPPALDVG